LRRLVPRTSYGINEALRSLEDTEELPNVMKSKSKNKSSPGQMKLPWDNWEIIDSDISKVAEKFVKANCTYK
jgi:hypothetical protein